jgi:hypothetical protein
MTRTSLLVSAMAALLATGSHAFAEEPMGWAQFKPGAWAKTRTLSVTEAGGMKMETSVETKTTLKELSPTEATLEMETSTATTMNGQETKLPPSTSSMKVPLTAGAGTASPAAAPPEPKADTTEETVTVAGKPIKCMVTKVTTQAGGSNVTARQWVSNDVPGGLVKSESTMDGQAASKNTTELIDFDAKK